MIFLRARKPNMKRSLSMICLVVCVLCAPSILLGQTVTQQAPLSGGPATFNPNASPTLPPATPQGALAPTNSAPQGAASANWPQYHYSQHNNPFYDGGTPGGMVSDTIDWFMALPSNLMDRMSEFVDTRFFPQKPATSGGASPGTANSAPAPVTLPPATAYTPGSN